MQLSQTLEAIHSLLLKNKEKDISYVSWDSLFYTEKLVDWKFSIVKNRFVRINNIEWTNIINYINKKVAPIFPLFFNLGLINLYNSSWLSSFIWDWMHKNTIVSTIFKLNNNEVFLSSLFYLIDEEKERLHVFPNSTQLINVQALIKSSILEFSSSSFPLKFKISDYIKSYNQYYKVLCSMENYKIDNIQIFGWYITFTISKKIKIGEIADLSFEEWDIFINSRKVYFQKRNTKIYNLFNLVFNYFVENNVNYVEFDDLEKYYKINSWNYPELTWVKFEYLSIRKNIEAKSQEIELKHTLEKTFIGINVSWISCQYYIPEKQPNSVNSVEN